MGKDEHRDLVAELPLREALEVLRVPTPGSVVIRDRSLRAVRPTFERHECFACGVAFDAVAGTIEPVYPFCPECSRPPEPWVELGLAG